MTTDREASGLAAVADLPLVLPSPAELDDVELALCGVDLVVQVSADAQVGDRLVLTDPEGTPLALLEVAEAERLRTG